jgi:hypothetical protein
MWEVKVLRGDVRVDVVERVDEASNDHNVLEDIPAGLDGRTFKAVGTGEKKRRGDDECGIKCERLGRTYGITLKRSLMVKLGTINFSSSTCSSGESTATVRFLSVAFDAIGEVGGREAGSATVGGRKKGNMNRVFIRLGSWGRGMCLRTSLNEIREKSNSFTQNWLKTLRTEPVLDKFLLLSLAIIFDFCVFFSRNI